MYTRPQIGQKLYSYKLWGPGKMCSLVQFIALLSVSIVVSPIPQPRVEPLSILSNRVVTLRYGQLRGVIVTPGRRGLHPVEKFLGVPYAAPPVGKLRFMPPKSSPRWDGIRRCDQMPPVCPQKLPDVSSQRDALKRFPEGRVAYLQRLLPHLQNQQEDCLYLNIYAPAKPEQGKQTELNPVMVYIHGESYEWNSGNPYDGAVLASYGNVIVVTVNFRLGVLGFLRPALSQSHTSNFGLLDQIAALDWVKKNIENFGGDPQRVTIFGHGTGAALANILLLSPFAEVSKGLFHRAILMSGSALSRWAVTWDPYKYTLQIGQAVGCHPSDRGDEMVTCLRQKSWEELVSVDMQTPPFTTHLGPIVDGVIVKDDPINTMRGDPAFGKYDMLYGVTQAESYNMLNANEVMFGMKRERRNRLLRAYISNNFKHETSQIYHAVENAYTKWNSVSDEDKRKIRDQTLEILSDAMIVAPVVRMANLHADLNPRSYFYVFNHQSTFGDYPVSQGTVHGEELPYVFGAPLVDGFNHFGNNYTREEIFLSELIMTHWTNFARTGNPNLPTPQGYKSPGAGLEWDENMKMLWPPYDKTLQQYLHYDMQVLTMDHYRAQKMSLWNHLIPGLVTSGGGTNPIEPPYRAPPTVISLVHIPQAPPNIDIDRMKPTPPYKPPHHPQIKTVPPYKPPPFEYPKYPNTQVEPPNSDVITTPRPPLQTGTPTSIVILVGIGILAVNCIAMGAVYYQRDRIRRQAELLKINAFGKKEDDEEDPVSEAPSETHSRRSRRRENHSSRDPSASGEDSVSRVSTISRDSTLRRKHNDSPNKSSSKSSSKDSSKSSNRESKRQKSHSSLYDEICRTEVSVHQAPNSHTKRSHSVKFDNVGLPPKSQNRSTSSITSKSSIKSTTSRASVKSTTSRNSIKSTASTKSLKKDKKNASCQSLPTAEYSWGITPEMLILQRDDPEGGVDPQTPVDRQTAVAAMQKKKYPKVLPDHADIHCSTLPLKSKHPAPARSTSLTAQDIKAIEDNIHVMYRNKRTARRDASTDSCGFENIYGTGKCDSAPAGTAMYGSPSPSITSIKTMSRKSDAPPDYVRTSKLGIYCQTDSYPAYESFTFQDGSTAPDAVPVTSKSPPILLANDPNKMYDTYEGSTLPPQHRGSMRNSQQLPNTSQNQISKDIVKHKEAPFSIGSTPTTTAFVPSANTAVTAAAQTAFATATAPAFMGASPSPNSHRKSAPSRSTSQSVHSGNTKEKVVNKVSQETSPSTMYEQTENTGTIKRKKNNKSSSKNSSKNASTGSLTKNASSGSLSLKSSLKNTSTQDISTKSSKKNASTQDVSDKVYEIQPVPIPSLTKPLKGVLKQKSAYDRPKAKNLAAAKANTTTSSSASASSLSSITSIEGDTAKRSNKTSSLNRILKHNKDNHTNSDPQIEHPV
ncbi:unnamed protein product [Meganyctiphanes norvegica]|uniref:acetylcholinesterase n=1 Tax=Meganyctiphanes norvegica TaxID=48144 RepID=A0AAV2PJK0_MEGNR